MYLGGAQGGIWISSTLTTQWTPQTDQLGSLAIGAIALAPSNEDIIYVGTGEGALSGDSYFGNGVLKSIDAGQTFTLVPDEHAVVFVPVETAEVKGSDARHNLGIVRERQADGLRAFASQKRKSYRDGEK
jgi:hypothetical protein